MNMYDFPILRIYLSTASGIYEKPKYPSPLPHPSTLIPNIFLKKSQNRGRLSTTQKSSAKTHMMPVSSCFKQKKCIKNTLESIIWSPSKLNQKYQ